MKVLSMPALILSIVGIALGQLFSAAIRLDDWLETTGRRTISERLLSLEFSSIIGYSACALIVATFGLLFGGLGGHLWWPQNCNRSCWIWIPLFVILCVCLAIGFYIGHHFFGQTR